MAVTIRLKRFGTNKKPFYRIVVAPSRNARDSKTVEELGYYDPKYDPPKISLDKERYQQWIAQGAKPSSTVRNLVKLVTE